MQYAITYLKARTIALLLVAPSLTLASAALLAVYIIFAPGFFLLP